MIRKTLTVLVVAAAASTVAAAPAFAVYGGQPTPDPVAAPWMVTIAVKGDGPLPQREECGGALIAPDRVATAGHCLDHVDPTHLELHLGAATLSADPGRVLPFKGWSIDPGYRLISSPDAPGDFERSSVANDIAVIQLAQPVHGVPVLPVATEAPKIGAAVSVYGHGLIKPVDPANPQASIGDVLQRGDLKVIDDQACQAAMPGMVDAPSVLCTRATTTVCSGDSGGPLVERTAYGPRLVGIVSFAGEVLGKQCGQDGYADGFADAAALRPFATQPHPTLAPMPAAEPTIAGTKAAGSTLTCQSPKWTAGTPDKVDYAWYQNKVEPDGFELYLPVDGTTTPTLAVTADLASHKIQCGITASTAGGTVLLYGGPA
ncbi:S1 family peptidase [Kutzneria sp. CA-103260]|uniref:S1 family peptidase n=1 Tax=Kutzneria sp. CA-103260 TaxID=2802641 RepID=UPI001BA6B6B4|nr:serine protease [Kutzneria sp. CA-103260]QUQ62960.1 Trypsin [Kutzneria sp. CA-103260]